MLTLRQTYQTIALWIATVVLTGCESLSYYWQAGAGQLDLMQRKTPIEQLLSDEKTAPALAKKLSLVTELRHYASDQLLLPVGQSYSEFVQLEDDFAVWNVYAAEPFSVVSYRWCYAVVGCMGYRGYFDRQQAEHYADKMSTQGYEVFVGGVAAYSTLGWFDDPVMSSFVGRSDLALASLLFHELAHRKLYIKGDTGFNESYATALAMIGLQRWQRHQSSLTAGQLNQWLQQQQRSAAFNALLLDYRQQLSTLYQRDGLDASSMQQQKRALFHQLAEDYQLFRQQWQGYEGYDRWMATVNNAKLATVADYQLWVDSFLQLYRQSEGELEVFYRRVVTLSEQDKNSRDQALLQLKQQYRSDERAD
jgi:predicted aminopeptidase